MSGMDEKHIARLFRAAGAKRWDVPAGVFAEALDRSVAKAFAGREPSPAERDRYLASLHLADLALACACAQGHEAAWDHFMREHRPMLYRAADAMDPSGGSREVADSLYAELYGLKERGGERRSLFCHFHGRSSLDTWMRAVLSQRIVDRVRSTRRLGPLPDEDSPSALRAPAPATDTAATDARRFASVMREALSEAMAAIEPRDRIRLGCYYAQEMTLAQIGRLMREHEATVSRHLARSRRAIRTAVEHRLRAIHRFGDREVDECFASITRDAGAMDLIQLIGEAGDRKNPDVDRSISGDSV